MGRGPVVLFWGSLPFRWRRVFALFTSACGVVFLVLALNTEGLREVAHRRLLPDGRALRGRQVSASASLPYYVVTGVLLALGLLGLAAGDEPCWRWPAVPCLNAVVLSWAVTALRFVLEKAAAPEPWARLMGVTWLAPVVGAYFCALPQERGRRLQGPRSARSAGYAFAVRGAVALLMVVASALAAGHATTTSPALTDVGFLGRTYALRAPERPSILTIAVVSQLVFWPIYTVVSGLIGAGHRLLLAWAWRGRRGPLGGARGRCRAEEPARLASVADAAGGGAGARAAALCCRR